MSDKTAREILFDLIIEAKRNNTGFSRDIEIRGMEAVDQALHDLRELLLAEIPKDHTEENPKCECDECYILFQVKEVIKKAMV